MEEWDPRDVSFITPPCNLHSFTLLLSSLSFSHHAFDHFSSSLVFLFFSFLSFRPSQNVGARFKGSLSPPTTSLPSSFHPSVSFSFRSCHLHFPCQQEDRNLRFLEKCSRERRNGREERRKNKKQVRGKKEE